jgi:elongation factor Ts
VPETKAYSVDDLKRLRDLTSAGMMDCRKALEDSGGDVDRAVALLRERGIATAAKRSERETGNGVVEAYLHRTSEDYPPQVGAMVELNCESDFVAKGTDFRALARELAIHIAGRAPRWVSRDQVPDQAVQEWREVHQIADGEVETFYHENVLLEQGFVRDPAVSVAELIAQTGAKVQENITVRRFSRFSIKEA